jgi:3-dehydroquinate dehydratase
MVLPLFKDLIMKWFKSKLRKRIEVKLVELTGDQFLLYTEQIKEKQTLNPARYSHYSVQIHDIEDKIKLLKELL